MSPFRSAFEILAIAIRRAKIWNLKRIKSESGRSPQSYPTRPVLQLRK